MNSHATPQQHPPAILQIYRDFVKPGCEAAYRAAEQDAARICVQFGCPHPHLAIESLTTPTEVWWLNEYASDADIERVANAYRSNSELMAALQQILNRKQDLVAPPDELFVRYQPDSSLHSPWILGHTAFVVVTVTRRDVTQDAAVFVASDGRKFIFRPVTTLKHANDLAASIGTETRLFALRPYWGMPARTWAEANPELWKRHLAFTKS